MPLPVVDSNMSLTLPQSRVPGVEFERLLANLEWQLVGFGSVELSARNSSPVGASVAAFHYVESGVVDLVGVAEPVRLKGGDLVLLSGAAAHRIRAVEDAVVRSAELDLQSTEGLFPTSVLPEVIIACEFVVREPQMTSLIDRLCRELGEGTGSSIMTRRLVTMIASMALRVWAEGDCSPQDWLDSLRDPSIACAITAMRAEPGRSWTVEDLARVTHASRSAFAKRFVDVTGESPARYLAALRMDRAKNMLLNRRATVGDIAAQLGYGSDAAFSRAFRRYAGASPALWRRESISSLVPASIGVARS